MLWAAHYTACAGRASTAGLLELAAQQLTAALRYVGIIPCDRRGRSLSLARAHRIGRARTPQPCPPGPELGAASGASSRRRPRTLPQPIPSHAQGVFRGRHGVARGGGRQYGLCAAQPLLGHRRRASQPALRHAGRLLHAPVCTLPAAGAVAGARAGVTGDSWRRGLNTEATCETQPRCRDCPPLAHPPDAVDEGGAGGGARCLADLEGADFVDTDIPGGAPLPAHHYCDERAREEVRAGCRPPRGAAG